MAVRPDQLSDELKKALLSAAREVNGTITTYMAEVATFCVNELRETSPERSGDYRRGWVRGKTKRGYVVHNTNYRLTHLLEDGHANRDGTRTGGIPHIGPAAEHAKDMLLARLEKELSK